MLHSKKKYAVVLYLHALEIHTLGSIYSSISHPNGLFLASLKDGLQRSILLQNSPCLYRHRSFFMKSMNSTSLSSQEGIFVLVIFSFKDCALMDFKTIKISNGNNFFSNGPIGLKFCRHGGVYIFSMPAKFQFIRTNRKKVTAVRNFDYLKIHQSTILKREDKNHLVAVCPPGSWLLTI